MSVLPAVRRAPRAVGRVILGEARVALEMTRGAAGFAHAS